MLPHKISAVYSELKEGEGLLLSGNTATILDLESGKIIRSFPIFIEDIANTRGINGIGSSAKFSESENADPLNLEQKERIQKERSIERSTLILKYSLCALDPDDTKIVCVRGKVYTAFVIIANEEVQLLVNRLVGSESVPLYVLDPHQNLIHDFS